MWRNYHEDWERKKSYLIRSLFHDIPLLSPVPEDHESRNTSSRDVSPLRAYSPLPPLIIEKLPNRHDHPPEFYDELEKKMKKLYRKLFHNEKSNSLEDLQEHYEQNVNYYTDVGITEKVGTESPAGHDESHFVTALELNYYNSSETARSIIDTGFKVRVYSPSSSSQTDNENSLGSRARSEETSSCDEIQSKTQVTVHRAPSLDVEDLQCVSPVHEDTAGCSSPILVLKQRKYRYLEDKKESSSDRSTDKTESSQDSDTADNVEKNENERSTCSQINLENDDIELMRRQRGVSPSLGSLENDLNDTEILSVNADDRYNKKSASMELQKEEDSLYDEDKGVHHLTFLQEIPTELGNVSIASSFNRFDDSSQSSVGHSSQTNGSFIPQSDEIPAVKRRKYENLGVQTSVTEEKDRINWHHLKTNFFVGIPKIYKLCSCDEHSCRNQVTN